MTDDVRNAPPSPVLAAWSLERARCTPVHVGLINRTWRVDREDGPPLALQQLHRIFPGFVNDDIDAITTALSRRGKITPHVVRTTSGARWLAHEGVWRALTWIEGTTVTRLTDARTARAAGELVGGFHAALDGFDHVFAHVRTPVHQLDRHLRTLRGNLEKFAEHRMFDAIAPVAHAILEEAASLPPLHADVPTRIVHGDLKISNLLFDTGLGHGVALVDLDTLAHGVMAHELGDAFRSWCNPAEEDDPAPVFDRTLFAAALEGYARGAPGLLTREEIVDLVPGVETIALELSARFAADALAEAYFGWDATRYGSRAEHNLARALGQHRLARSVRAQRDVLNAIVRDALG